MIATFTEADLALRQRVADLYADYAHAIDDDRLEDWPGFFVDAGVYRIVTRENRDLGLPVALMYCDGRGMMEDRVAALRTANIYEPHVYNHTVSAVRIVENDQGTIRTRSNFSILRTVNGGDMSIYACGRSYDEIVEDQGVLRFRARLMVLDSRQIDTLMAIPV
jgi:anthranilate 1,2-dioxygenase small subunit